MDDVKADVKNLEKAASEINLFLIHDKSEIICVDKPSNLNMLSFSASLRMIDPARATLLGSPIGGMGGGEWNLSTLSGSPRLSSSRHLAAV